MKRPVFPFWPALTVFALLLASVETGQSDTNELNLKAQLIWGTNNEKPVDPKLKELDAKTSERLRKVFKWKYYFEVNQHKFTVSHTAPKKVKMSDRCEIEVQNLGNYSVEVKLYGEHKLVVQKRESIRPYSIVLAGDDKNDTAWFVILSLAGN